MKLKILGGISLLFGILIYRGTQPISPEQLHTILHQSVVKILDQTGLHGGTGFAARGRSGQEYIITNRHVCDGVATGNQMVTVLVDTGESQIKVPRRILVIHSTEDICIVEGLASLKPLQFGPPSAPNDYLHILGNPILQQPRVYSGTRLHALEFNLASPMTPDSTCAGEVQDFFMFKVCVIKAHGIEINAHAYPGNSGSPILNTSGQVVGILFAGNNELPSAIFADVRYIEELLNLL